MVLIKGTIGLGIRERKSLSNPEQFKQARINQWVTDLPKANLGETSKLVFQLLQDANTHLLSASERNNLLSSVNQTIDYITTSLKKHYIGQSVSLSEKQQKISNFSQAIEVEAAIGYKTIIEDLLVDEKFTSNLLVISINACMHYFYNIQTRCYQLYCDLPKGMWHEIHLLYQLAEQNQFHDKKITLVDKAITVASTYKKILLLSTINPNQLRQQEISQIAKHLGKLNRKFSLGSSPDADYSFVANLNSDAGPFHRALVSGDVKPHYRGFDLIAIVDEIESELQNKSKEQRILGINDNTQKHLLRSWGSMATRTFARTPGDGDIEISVGLAASHYLIDHELHGEEEAQELLGSNLVDSLEGSLKDAIVLGGEDNNFYTQGVPKTHPGWNDKTNGPQLRDDSMWDSMYRNKAAQETNDDSKPYEFMDKANQENSSRYNYNDATIINISPGGYCLKLVGDLPKQTQTGEIIGLLETAEGDQFVWNIGTIRWMKRTNHGELELGVQLISAEAEPVFGQFRTSHSDDKNYQRCLLLPAIEGIGQPETLLTSPMPFKEHTKVRIKSVDGEKDIHLKNMVASGYSFKQFTFEYLESIDDPESGSSGDDFDAVWEMI